MGAVGYGLLSPAGEAFKVKVCSRLRRGKFYGKLGLYACPAGAAVKKFAIACGGASLLVILVSTPTRRGSREKVCYHLRWGRSFTRLE